MTSGLSAAVDDLPAPWPKADNPQSVVIIKADRPFQATLERGAVCDVTCALVRLTQTLDRLQAANAIAEEVHLRPDLPPSAAPVFKLGIRPQNGQLQPPGGLLLRGQRVAVRARKRRVDLLLARAEKLLDRPCVVGGIEARA